MAGLYYWKVIGHHLRNLALPGGVAFFLLLVELSVKQCFRRRSVLEPNLAAEPDPPPATVVFPPNEQIARAGAYRIPSLLALPPAASPVLLSFAEERTIGGVEDGGPVRVVVRRSGDRGQTWSPVALVADGDSVGIPGGTVGNPCAIYDAVRGRVVLLLSASEAYESEATIWCGHAAARRVFVTTSCDGAAWSRPREISSDVRPKGAGPTSPSGWTWYATGPGVGVQLPGGRLVFPCNHVSPTRGWLRTRYELRSHVVISDDGGDSFRLGGEGPAECNEAQVALVGGRLLLSMRDWSGQGRRRVAVSEDEGESWRDLGHAGDLPDPGFAGCQASLLAVPGGALYCGPLGAPSGLTRHTLLLRASRDGLSWGGAAEPSAGLWARVLHRGPAAYSCVARVGEGLVAVLYEAGETRPDEQIRCCLVAHPAP